MLLSCPQKIRRVGVHLKRLIESDWNGRVPLQLSCGICFRWTSEKPTTAWDIIIELFIYIIYFILYLDQIYTVITFVYVSDYIFSFRSSRAYEEKVVRRYGHFEIFFADLWDWRAPVDSLQVLYELWREDPIMRKEAANVFKERLKAWNFTWRTL